MFVVVLVSLLLLFVLGVMVYKEINGTSGGDATTIHANLTPQQERIVRVLERSGEIIRTDTVISGVDIPIYLPEHTTGLVFDPESYMQLHGSHRVFLIQDNMPLAAVIEMLPFDIDAPTNMVDTTHSDDDVGVARLCDSLDVDYTPEDPDSMLSDARQKMKEVHPDKGGSKEEFMRTVSAYKSLKRRLNG